MVKTRGLATLSVAEEEARAKETAATLIDSFAKVRPNANSSVPYENGSQSDSSERTNYATVLSSIGLGIDPSIATESLTDATDFAVKAVRDAMERAVLRFPDNQANLHLHLKLGVPPKRPGLNTPMNVNIARLTPLLPSHITLLPVEVVVGGLMVPLESPTSNTPSTAVCAAVACVTLHQVVPQTEPGLSSPTSVAASGPVHSPVVPPSSWEEVERQTAMPSEPEPPKTHHGSFAIVTAQHASPEVVHRSTSIEMLARISAEIHEQQPPVPLPLLLPTHKKRSSEDRSIGSNGSNPCNYNYKKLPPGVTPKNNKRLFVKHSYTDHSHEVPIPEELDLLGPSAAIKTPNAAFPLKLHETLAQIEMDGHDDIIGWLPHGRSFKIHKHHEFVETILPKYFIMTKKSSFLRQLNLYGFNRLSGVGPDQGSYYHEKFLRGMKFLSRRMQRQKVNGNGIRAAGNPDEEPNLSRYPACPPVPHQAMVREHQHAFCLGSSQTQHQLLEPVIEEIVRVENHVEPPDATILKSTSGVSFPLKLQRILDKLEAEDKTDIVSWLSHGRAFLVHNPDRFVNELMPVFFNQTKYSSFQRQLHMYNFQRITAGRDKGAYHNPNFLRGRPQLALKMHRTRVNGKGTRRPGNPQTEPDFYLLEPMPIIAYGTKIEIPNDFPVGAVAASDESGSGDES